MERELVIERSREYLVEVGYNAVEVSISSDEQVLSSVNTLHFGGIQAFARNVKNERDIILSLP